MFTPSILYKFAFSRQIFHKSPQYDFTAVGPVAAALLPRDGQNDANRRLSQLCELA